MKIAREETACATLRALYFAEDATYRFVIDAAATLETFDVSTLISRARCLAAEACERFRTQPNAPRLPNMDAPSLLHIIDELHHRALLRSRSDGRTRLYEVSPSFVAYQQKVAADYDALGWVR